LDAKRDVLAFGLMPDEGHAIPGIGTLKISGLQTAGAFEVIEFAGPDAPPHVHRAREEAFFVLAGSFTFTLGEDTLPAPRGAVVFVPRGVRHGFRSEAGSKALLLVAPAGLEGYFRALGRALQAGRPPAEVRRELAAAHDSIPA
jgi:quercetin dioxygenase-like cupin family protein